MASRGSSSQRAEAGYIGGLAAFRLGEYQEAIRLLDLATGATDAELRGMALIQRGTVEMAQGLADPEIYGLLTGTKVEHKEREAPAGGDGEEPKRRNSVSQQNLADFTDAFQDANRASAEEF